MVHLSIEIFLVLVSIAAIPFVVRGLSWLFNPDRRRSRRRAPEPSDGVDRERFRPLDWLGPLFMPGDYGRGGGGGDGFGGG